MAASPKSPSMRDQWSVRDKPKNSEHSRPRHKEKSDQRQRSPLPPRRRDHERSGRGGRGGRSSGAHHRYPPHQFPPRKGDREFGSPGAEPPLSHRPDSPQAWDAKHPLEDQVRRPQQRKDSSLSPPPRRRSQPTGPPSKRRRSRSPSPGPLDHVQRSQKKGFASRDRPGRGRGQQQPRRFASNEPPRREKHSRHTNNSHADESIHDRFSRRRQSRSPASREEDRTVGFSRAVSRCRSPIGNGHTPSRPSSRRSLLSKASRASSSSRHPHDIQSNHPIRSAADDPLLPPSSSRQAPGFDSAGSADEGIRDAFSMNSIPPSDARVNRRTSRPRLDTKQHYNTSPQFGSVTPSRHASPRSGSPYSGGRGSWSSHQQQPPPSYQGQQRQMHGYSPPYRSNYQPPASQSPYYPDQPAPYPSSNQMHQGYPDTPYRGGAASYRGSHYGQPPDRRFSGSGSREYGNPPPHGGQRGRGANFTNVQSGGGRGRGNAGPGPDHAAFQPADEPESPDPGEDDNPFRPSKDLRVEDEQSVKKTESTEPKAKPASSPAPKESGKFSFAFKSKAAPAPAPKPVPDIAQRMREPPRSADPSKGRPPPPSPLTKGKHDSRLERRDRGRDAWRYDRRYDRDDRRRDRRDDRPEPPPPPRHERRRGRERSPLPPPGPPPREKPRKKIIQRMKPRPTLSEDFADADSVYYRKPGNESVIGAGTYGKVFKAIHIYTKNKVALKRIRMEGEKDGFPITAVREIRLLQHLRHGNIVSLQEVMVEKNECFMVFEYLSHDLTGLINHPTFSLSPAHKKHLARQMFDGLNYLHHRGVLHRDIKAANILISNRGELKFADFGLARFFSKSRPQDYTNRVITIWYRPPELLLGETRYTPAVDVWSAACVYIEMFTKKAIFPGDGSEINQLDKLYTSLGTPTRPDWPGIVDMPWFELMRPTERKKRTFEAQFQDSLSPAAIDLVAQIFQYDPAKRPSTEEVLAHPYFTFEEPLPQQAVELSNIEGDWHEFESKAHRKERDKEARRAEQQQREREKRKAGESSVQSTDREHKRPKIEEGSPGSGGVEN